MTYTIEYFIEKFEKIPEGFVIDYELANACDKVLSFKDRGNYGWIFTGLICGGHWGSYKIAPTPKQRILLALEVERDLRDWRRDEVK